MPSVDRAVLILAGGAGTRLWPLSTDERPKQFLRIFEGRSLIESTFARLVQHAEPKRIFVSTNDRYRNLVAEQLPGIPFENILVEPARRNTGPAIAACCAEIERRCGNVVVGIFPSDHAIGDTIAFRDVVEHAIEFASRTEYLVTVGIQPTEPHTGFGYLELAESLDGPIHRLERFVEKPSLEVARTFIERGNYLWNGGMFVWRLDVFFLALAMASPDIAEGARRFAQASDPEAGRTAFESMPSISIDYALMEKSPKVATVRGDFAWSDVGSWAAAAKLIDSPSPDAVLEQTANVFVLSTTSRPVAVVGARDLFVIDSPEGLLVLDASSGERLSGVVRVIESKDWRD